MVKVATLLRSAAKNLPQNSPKTRYVTHASALSTQGWISFQMKTSKQLLQKQLDHKFYKWGR